MKYPKIFYFENYIEFGSDANFQNFQSDLFDQFLEGKHRQISFKVSDQQEYHEVWKQMLKKLEPIEAAGGIVKNLNNQYLMIYRLGKWDFPKGKVEKGENPEITALREIEEEVHIPMTLLSIDKFIDFTYHIYPHNHQFMIKTTYWYEVNCNCENVILQPQKEEDIIDAQWFTKEQILEANTYISIKNLLNEFFYEKEKT